jgi:hypothetical protein
LAVGSVIHIPQIPNFTQLVLGFGIVTIGRNPSGIGRLFSEFEDFMARRRGVPDVVVDRLDPAFVAHTLPEVRSVG